MNQFPGELSGRLMKVEVMKLRAGVGKVFPSATLRSARTTAGLGKRSLGRLSNHGSDLNVGRQLWQNMLKVIQLNEANFKGGGRG